MEHFKDAFIFKQQAEGKKFTVEFNKMFILKLNYKKEIFTTDWNFNME